MDLRKLLDVLPYGGYLWSVHKSTVAVCPAYSSQYLCSMPYRRSVPPDTRPSIHSRHLAVQASGYVCRFCHIDHDISSIVSPHLVGVVFVRRCFDCRRDHSHFQLIPADFITSNLGFLHFVPKYSWWPPLFLSVTVYRHSFVPRIQRNQQRSASSNSRPCKSACRRRSPCDSSALFH